MNSSIRGFFAVAMLFGVCTPSQAALITIDFGPLSGANLDPYSGHVEDGFTISPILGEWFEAHLFGNPIPDIFAGPIFSPSPSAIEVTGGLFAFQSVDLTSNIAPGSTFLIQGFLSSVLVFSQAGTIGNVNTFNLIASLNPATFVDRLTILMTPDLETSSMNLDNIVLDTAPAPTPEPSALALLGLGVAGLLCFRNRHRRGTHISTTSPTGP